MPTATVDKNGLADAALNYQFINATLNKIFLIGQGEISEKVYTFKLIQAKNDSEIGKAFSIFFVGITLFHDNLYTNILGINGNPFNAKFFVKDNSLYYQVNSLGGYLFAYGSNVKITETQLPEDAKEVKIVQVS